MRRIVYSKYSNERAHKFNIKTSILQDEQYRRIVQKVGASSESREHIENIYNYSTSLSDVYAGTDFNINECLRVGEVLEFKYIEGKTLEEKLDELLAEKDYIEIVNIIKKYADNIYNVKRVSAFNISKEFIDVFGNVRLPHHLQACDISNIDLIFSNIIVTDKWTVIDYEWTFEFQVPLNFIIYRAIHYYLYGSVKRQELLELGFYKLLGISSDEIDQYKKMEENFQNYILGNMVPLRNLYNSMGKMSIQVQDVILKEKINRAKESIQVFYDYGQGLTEENSYVLNLIPDDSGCVKFEIPVAPSVKGIRIDPANDSCIVIIHKLVGIGSECYVFDYETNGTDIEEKVIVYTTPDPQIVLKGLGKETNYIKVELEVKIVPENICLQITQLIKSKLNLINEIQQIKEFEKLNELSLDEKNKEIEYLNIKYKDEIEVLVSENKKILLHISEQKEKINDLVFDNDNLCKNNQELQEEISNKSSIIEQLQNQSIQQTEYISNIENTKVWKAYMIYKRILKRRN